MADPMRQTKTITSTTVRQHMDYTERGGGKAALSPPTLDQLRRFVDACEGLDGGIEVHISKSALTESGRYSWTFSLDFLHPTEAVS